MIKFKTKSKKNNENSINEDFDKRTLDFSKKKMTEKKETTNPKVNQINILKNSNYQNISNMNIISSERTSYFKKSNQKAQKILKFQQSKTMNNNNGLNQKDNDLKIYEIDIESEKKMEKKRVIKKLDTNVFCIYFCFCCSKREKILQILL